MKLGVVMGDIAVIHPERDTTLGLLYAAQRLKWEISYFTLADIRLCDGEVRGDARTLTVKDPCCHPEVSPHSRSIPMASLDVILIRQNPPVDENYIAMCQMLEMTEDVLIVNHPAGIRMANEKMFAQHFADLQPPTLFCASHDEIRKFINRYKEAVIKPLNGLQGDSVFRVSEDDVNTDTILENATDNERRVAVVQKLIPGYEKGDKRILLIDGEPVGHALLRVPQPGKLRANLAAGGKPLLCDVDKRDREICTAIAPALREHGLLFVGIDVIGGYLTEINVTSPTGMREIDNLSGADTGMEVMSKIMTRL